MNVLTLTMTSLTCFAVGAGFLGHALATAPLAPRPVHGHRGAMRLRALETSFGLFELPMRLLAGALARLPLAALRTRLDALALRSGRHLGLDADDCLGLCLVSMACFGAGAGLLVAHGSLSRIWIVAALCLGAVLPLLSLRERARARARQISRALPTAIDLAALCMDAGLDFAGALALLARDTPEPDDHLVEEIKLVLAELSMGRTRRDALGAFAERAPTPAVQDFVSAVVQAETKGNPLAEALEVQAQLLRVRRCAAGEEAAARASVLLALPLLLLLCAILLVMLGPLLVGGAGLA